MRPNLIRRYNYLGLFKKLSKPAYYVKVKEYHMYAASHQFGSPLGFGMHLKDKWKWQGQVGCRSVTSVREGLSDEQHAKFVKSTKKKEREKVAREENKKIMAKLFDVKPSEIKRVPRSLIDEEKVGRIIKLLNEFGLPLASVRMYPELLAIGLTPLENYIRIMRESCFPSIREALLVRFRHVYNQTITFLQGKLQLPDINTIVYRYCVELEQDESFRKNFIRTLPTDQSRLTLYDLRTEIIASYLSKLSVGDCDELKGLFTTYPRLQYRSLYSIKQNYKTLKDLGFPNEKIKRHVYVLHADCHQVSQITQIPSLAGVPIKEMVMRRPKILMSTCETLTDIDRSLIRHGIPFESVRLHPEIYTLASATIQKRLEDIDSTPEFQLMKNHPRVARLLYYHNKAKTRLEEFKAVQIRVPSLHILSSDTARYKRVLATGDLRIRGVDILFHLSDLFQVSKKRVSESIKRHPHWLNIPLVSIKSVLQYLEQVGPFTTDQLVDAIPMLLYPLARVQQGIQDTLNAGAASPSDPYFLQMVLYFIERPSHFSGDAIWPDKAEVEFDEDNVNEEVEPDDQECEK